MKFGRARFQNWLRMYLIEPMNELALATMTGSLSPIFLKSIRVCNWYRWLGMGTLVSLKLLLRLHVGTSNLLVNFASSQLHESGISGMKSQSLCWMKSLPRLVSLYQHLTSSNAWISCLDVVIHPEFGGTTAPWYNFPTLSKKILWFFACRKARLTSTFSKVKIVPKRSTLGLCRRCITSPSKKNWAKGTKVTYPTNSSVATLTFPQGPCGQACKNRDRLLLECKWCHTLFHHVCAGECEDLNTCRDCTDHPEKRCSNKRPTSILFLFLA